jgi:hypothetical protein
MKSKVFSNHVRWCESNPNRYVETDINKEKRISSLKANYFLKKIKQWKEYYLAPKICIECGSIIDWFHKNNKFCSATCGAINSNKKRPCGHPSRLKGNESRSRKNKKVPPKHSEMPPPYTKVYFKICKITGKSWWTPIHQLRIHPSAILSFKDYSYQCRFTFGISKYSSWFNYSSELISEYGWYAAKNRGDNLNGCSRDHLYSVYDGFKNKIDPKIISHPANCEIKPHKENQHKHSKSSITIEQLLERISYFEKQYGTTI